MVQNPDFRLSVIGDLSCDIKGTIEITKRATASSEPAFVYDPVSKKISNDLSHSGIAVMAIDNLPCEFPKESSDGICRTGQGICVSNRGPWDY